VLSGEENWVSGKENRVSSKESGFWQRESGFWQKIILKECIDHDLRDIFEL